MDANRSDEELAGLVGGGDEAAFADLYNRHFPRVYDFALRISRDRDIAALVVQSTFLRLYHQMRSSTLDQAPFAVQVFAGAHFDLAERLRGRRGGASEPEEVFSIPDATVASMPGLGGDLPELARITWRAASELKLDDYEVIDFMDRRGLKLGEISALLRARPEAIERKANVAHAQLEESLSAQLLFSRGRQTCIDLDLLVAEETWSPSLRKRVARHLQTCLTCQAFRTRYPAAAALLAGLLPVPAPDGWQETILTRLHEAMRTGAQAPAPVAIAAIPATEVVTSPAAGLGAEPLPASTTLGGPAIPDWAGGVLAATGSRGPLVIVLAGALLVLAIALGTLCAAGAFDGGNGGFVPTATVTGTPTVTRTATATITATGTITRTPLPAATATNTAPPATSTAVILPPTPTPPPPTPPRTNTRVPPPTSTPP